MKKYRVVDVNFTHPSFSWASGRYFIYKIHEYGSNSGNDGTYEMVKLDGDNPQRFDDGRYMTSHTGLKNDGITKTNLVYDERTSKIVPSREAKLERILKK